MTRHCRSNFAAASVGFTLIELIVVLLIISVTMAMAAPSLHGWSDGAKLRDAGDQFIASARWARAQAILTGTPHVLKVDAAAGTYMVGSAEADGTSGAMSVTPVSGEYGQRTAMPQSFRIDLIGGGESGGTIVFYANGRCTPAQVRITSVQQKTLDIASTFPADPFRVVTPR